MTPEAALKQCRDALARFTEVDEYPVTDSGKHEAARIALAAADAALTLPDAPALSMSMFATESDYIAASVNLANAAPVVWWRRSTLPECMPCATTSPEEAQAWRDEGHDVREMREAAPPAPDPVNAKMLEAPTRDDLVAALEFYAKREHMTLSDGSAWDTVSGEPQNWWCDEAGTATIEDGTIAKETLAGKLTAEQINAMEDGEEFPDDSDTAAEAAQPKTLDDPRLQELFSATIDGALTTGYQGGEAPPAGHWLTFWYDKGRAVAAAEAAQAQPAAPAAGGEPLTLKAAQALILQRFLTGENMRRDTDNLFRSAGTPSNVWGVDLLWLVREVEAAHGITEGAQHG